ncbi:18188_t:CDS:2, partial [Racocetra persica]
ERVIASNIKNKIIYTGSDEEAYAEILRQHKAKRDAIFFSTEKQIIENDPFRPSKLPKTRNTTSIINSVTLYKFDNRHNIGVEDQKTTGNEANRQVSNLNEKSGENVPPSRKRKIENSALKDLFNEQEINWN